jgi:hypothetical protein
MMVLGADTHKRSHTIALTFATRLAHRYPHVDGVAFLRSSGVDVDHNGGA